MIKKESDYSKFLRNSIASHLMENITVFLCLFMYENNIVQFN